MEVPVEKLMSIIGTKQVEIELLREANQVLANQVVALQAAQPVESLPNDEPTPLPNRASRRPPRR